MASILKNLQNLDNKARYGGSAVMMFKDPYTTKDETLSFVIDVTSSISTSISATATKFPVEDKSTITDHIQPKPLVLTVECLISESPSDQLMTLATAAVSSVSRMIPNSMAQNFARAAVTAQMGAIVDDIGKKNSDIRKGSYSNVNFAPLLTDRSRYDKNFPKRAMAGLLKMFNHGTLFNFHTFFTKDIYTDMVMTSLSFSQTPKEGDSLAFSMTCEHVSTTTATVASAKNMELKAASNASSSASKKKKKGPVKTKEEKKEIKSALAKGKDGLSKGLDDFINSLYKK